MIQRLAQGFDSTLNLHGLVNGAFRETTASASEQSHGVVRIPAAVSNPDVAHVVAAGNAIAVGSNVGSNDAEDFMAQRFRNTFVSIEGQDPLAAGVVKGKILLWAVAAKRRTDHGSTRLSTNRGGVIHAFGVHHNDFVSKTHAVQTGANAERLIARDHDNGQFHRIREEFSVVPAGKASKLSAELEDKSSRNLPGHRKYLCRPATGTASPLPLGHQQANSIGPQLTFDEHYRAEKVAS